MVRSRDGAARSGRGSLAPRSGRRVVLGKTLVLARGADGVLHTVSLGRLRVLSAWRSHEAMGEANGADVVLVDAAAALGHVVQADLDGLVLDRGGPGELVLSREEVDELLAAEAPRTPGTFTPTQLVRPDGRKISGELPIPKPRP